MCAGLALPNCQGKEREALGFGYSGERIMSSRKPTVFFFSFLPWTRLAFVPVVCNLPMSVKRTAGVPCLVLSVREDSEAKLILVS